jgi:hypothetical protein
MNSVGDDSRGPLSGRSWLIVGFALAIAATLAMVLSNDLRWLRLGIIAALWAALIGAFLAARYRRNITTTEEAVAEAQAVYELELEREIAARREYELELEAETRERVEADSREELDALRSEVVALRDSLQSLFGGDVLFERVALTAQSTRMRSLHDDQWLVTAGEGNGKTPPQLTAAKKKEIGDRPTELIERVIENGVAPVTDKRPSGPARVLKVEEAGPPTRRVAKADVVPAESAAEATRRQQAPAESPRREPRRPEPSRAEPSRAQPPRAQPPRAQPPRAPQPARQPRPEPAPAVKATPPRRPEPPKTAPRTEPQTIRTVPERIERGRPAASPAPRPSPRQPVEDPEPDWMTALDNARREREAAPPAPEPPAPEPARSRHGGHHAGGGEPTTTHSRTEAPPTGPDPVRETQPSRQGGRRRHADDEASPSPRRVASEPADTADSAGGRRRRSDGEQLSWQELAARESGDTRHATGSHARPDTAGEGAHGGAGTPGRRAAHGAPSQDDGDHTQRSVSELLAAHGSGDSPPRRRRRAAD